MNNKTIITLLIISTITIPISVNAMLETWIGVDCTTLGSSGMIPICNDINDLNYRLDNVEHSNTGISSNSTLNYLVIPVNVPVQIDGFIAWIYTLDVTDRIILNLTAPNGTEIYTSPQPITFTPDVIGQWIITASVSGNDYARYIVVEDGQEQIINTTLEILYGDDGDFIQINATGFYPYDPVSITMSQIYLWGYDFAADSNGNLFYISDRDLQVYISPQTSITVELRSITGVKDITSILYEGQ